MKFTKGQQAIKKETFNSPLNNRKNGKLLGRGKETEPIISVPDVF